MRLVQASGVEDGGRWILRYDFNELLGRMRDELSYGGFISMAGQTIVQSKGIRLRHSEFALRRT